MARPGVFVDTSGFYALLIRGDSKHALAREIIKEMRDSGTRALTSDYVVDETATLLKARGFGHLVGSFFRVLDHAEALALYFMEEERFQKSRLFFERHADHAYSFTDCTSFVIMRELGATDALSKDDHFREAGFKALLIGD